MKGFSVGVVCTLIFSIHFSSIICTLKHGGLEKILGKVAQLQAVPIKAVPLKLKTDDTSNEPGSGDDDEDIGVKKVNSSGTFEGSGRGEPDEGSGSGDESSGMVPTRIPPVKTEIRPSTTDTVLEISTEKATEKITQEKPSKPSPSTVATTRSPNEIPDTYPNNIIKQETTKKPTDSTTDEVEVVNSVSPTTIDINNNNVDVSVNDPSVEQNNGNDVAGVGRTGQQKANENSQKKGLSFSVGIIIGVAIGAILAILIILFLVYRLRKKDEGSYSLDEPITGYQRHDAAPGSPLADKEYYA